MTFKALCARLPVPGAAYFQPELSISAYPEPSQPLLSDWGPRACGWTSFFFTTGGVGPVQKFVTWRLRRGKSINPRPVQWWQMRVHVGVSLVALVWAPLGSSMKDQEERCLLGAAQRFGPSLPKKIGLQTDRGCILKERLGAVREPLLGLEWGTECGFLGSPGLKRH
jgi:hypothetical protein